MVCYGIFCSGQLSTKFGRILRCWSQDVNHAAKLTELLLPTAWDVSPSRAYPRQYIDGTHLHTWVKRYKIDPDLQIWSLGCLRTWSLGLSENRSIRNNNNNNNNNNNKNNSNNPNLLLITKLTIKSYLQLISLNKLFCQSTIYIIPFDWKNHSIKNILYIRINKFN